MLGLGLQFDLPWLGLGLGFAYACPLLCLGLRLCFALAVLSPFLGCGFAFVVALPWRGLALPLLGIGFAFGGDFNKKYANKIMRLRILLQAIAILLIIFFVYFSRGN